MSKQNKTPEVIPEEVQNKTPEVIPEEVVPVLKERKPKKQPVDAGKYSRYTQLKFVELSGTKLKEESQKEMNALEAELKACTGAVPIRTQRAAISNEQVLLVEGVPVPEAIAKIIASSKNPEYYTGE